MLSRDANHISPPTKESPRPRIGQETQSSRTPSGSPATINNHTDVTSTPKELGQ